MSFSYMTREQIMERLKVSRRATYRLFGSPRSRLFKSSDVVHVLNLSRRNGAAELDTVPDDLLTEEEAAAEFGIPIEFVYNWTLRRRVHTPPFYRLSDKARRFSRSQLNTWLLLNSAIHAKGRRSA